MFTTPDTRTSGDPADGRAQRTLDAERLNAPATVANTARNARAEIGRHARWGPARAALWRTIDPRLIDGARVLIVGAGNGDTIPLDRIAARATEVTLVDIDPSAIRSARRRQPRRLRHRITLLEHDITNGAANAISAAAARGEVPDAPAISEAPLPGSPYELVIGDLLYSQLLYPALRDLDVPLFRTQAFVDRYAPVLTRGTVARLEISAPTGNVIHVHDPIAWWPGHQQPVTLELLLEIARTDPTAALRLAARASGPHQSDPRAALRALSIPILETVLWHWPFAPTVDYLACATITNLTGASSEAESR